MIQGIAPGPQVMNDKPQLFLGLIARCGSAPDAGDPEPAADRHVDQAAHRA